MRPGDFCLLLMKAKNPKDGRIYYFVDKCLPFGSSISCAIFQDFSNAIAYLMFWKTQKSNINYLDDYLFVAYCRAICNAQVNTFMDLCEEISFPVAIEKTEWASNIIIFLGLLIDLINQVVCIPVSKVDRARQLIGEVLGSKKHKATVLQIQRLAGFLNFLCKVVIPGRTFTARLYSLTSGKLKPYHHVRVPLDVRQDLEMWKYS